jgi:predicted TIM-barrel fold metal-dependent hydrolase
MKIFANHAHVFPPELRPEGTVDRLLSMLDACGIEKAVCFAPFPHELTEHNQWLARELKGRDRLVGFGTLDLRRDDLRDQVRRVVDLGLRGLKMHPNVQEFDLLGPEALLAYEAAQEAGLFVSFHSGVHRYRIQHYNVLKFDEIAWRFPDLRFSMEHVGGWAFFTDAVAVICNNIPFPPVPGKKCRVYGGLTSVFTPDYIRMWYMPPERMTELVRQVGAEQLIFGLDFPYNLEENTRMGLSALQDLPVSEGEREAILGGNLREVLGIA